MDMIDWVLAILKCGIVLFFLVNIVPIMAWVERRGMALMQQRLGPNRVGPFGLLQSLADAIKFIFKEDRIPRHTDRFYYFIAPLVAVVPAFMGFAVIPFASTIEVDGRLISFQAANLNVGLLYIFAISSLGVYGIMLAAWASNSKYAQFGGLRASAQMVSYELALGLAVVGIIMTFSSLDLQTIVRGQGEALLHLGPLALPKWGIFIQPIGFFIAIVCLSAETNRIPFDFAEGESEIVAGYHLEYGSMKFALFMMAEYVHLTTASGLLATLYFGGWQLLPGMHLLQEPIGAVILSVIGETAWTSGGLAKEWARIVLETLSFTIKLMGFMLLFVQLRWTLPRFRYDQAMFFGWKVLLPLALANVFATGLLIYYGVI